MKYNNFFITLVFVVVMQSNISFAREQSESYASGLFTLGGFAAFLGFLSYIYNKPKMSYADIINHIIEQKKQIELAANKIIEAKNAYERAKKIAEDNSTSENIQKEEDAKTKAIEALSIATEIAELLKKY